MKAKLIVGLFLLIMNVLNAQLTSVPDRNFENYIEALGLGNGIYNDGLVDSAKISSRDSIAIRDRNVSDFTGIEGFTSLINLDCSGNNLTNLDLSANINLVELNCENNNISNLNVTGNVDLESLNCNNNNLSNIDVSSNTKLTSLSVVFNNLSSLEVSMLVDLELLFCAQNQLNEISVENNTKLRTLSCNSNAISQLNLYSNPNLKTVLCSENQISALDLSLNPLIDFLSVGTNGLKNLNVKNGNNNNMDTGSFFTSNNPDLSCVQVDDVVYSETNWTNIDNTTNFSESCAVSNDDCTNAIPVVLEQTIAGNTAEATSINSALCANGITNSDIWFSFLAPTSGEVLIEGSSVAGVLKFSLLELCESTSEISCGTTIDASGLEPNSIYYVRTWVESNNTGKQTNTLNTDGIFTFTVQDTNALSLDKESITKNDVTVYPNPTNSMVSIKSQLDINTIVLYSILGNKVLETHNNNIDVSNLKSGTYIIKINTQKGTLNKKLVIN